MTTMATPSVHSGCSFLANKYLISFCVFVCLNILSSLDKGFALSTHQTDVQLSSLLPASTCSPSTRGHDKKKATLKVVHRHGPCSKMSQPNQYKTTTPTHTQILQQDQARVTSIHSRMGDNLRQTDASIPAKSGSVVGSGNYIVTVGLGSPAKQLSLIFDTGSDLTWTQCQPCVRSCYKQKEPIFDPSLSKSYTNISCNSPFCSQLISATGTRPYCRNGTSTCVYDIQYRDKSFSVGFFAKERLTLTSTDYFDGFLFGCGQNNQGLFGGSGGLLGLGPNKISLVEQSAKKYGRFFSYCLPSTSCATGYLSFGKGGGPSKAVKFMPLSIVSGRGYLGGSFYGLDVIGINVGGRRVSIPALVFSSSGTIIDTGTMITRLPATAYNALRDAFKRGMKSYPQAEALSILDTCYDLSGSSKVSYPKIAFAFSGGLTLDLDATGIFYVASASQVCLAFAGNSDDSDIAIFGNVQQKRLQVVYDVAGGKIGFAPAGCP
ncbi:aspartyl protease family protein At5g10770 isoform X1 [Rosa chinensis]|uniref:aspartyl protease family protein At5g10770 isoform X1 n=2 Tax=Rosa chinensis TaxID=74649 RepID=UPI000D08BA9B|nr:aspartyl protease family protein At5g10770 isoform X1 [Rosa chinensis]